MGSSASDVLLHVLFYPVTLIAGVMVGWSIGLSYSRYEIKRLRKIVDRIK